MYRRRPIAKMAAVLVGINVIYFLFLSFKGSTLNTQFMLDSGALYVPSILEEHEYYRLVTSMFMHFGIEHLFFNMILLYYLGMLMEDDIGSLGFGFIYLFSGLIGNILSVAFYAANNRYVVSAGASGAVFGMVGVMAWMIVKNRGYYRNVGIRQVALMVFFSLYNGFTEGGINNVAHIAGLVSGFLAAALLYRKGGKL